MMLSSSSTAVDLDDACSTRSGGDVSSTNSGSVRAAEQLRTRLQEMRARVDEKQRHVASILSSSSSGISASSTARTTTAAASTTPIVFSIFEEQASSSSATSSDDDGAEFAESSSDDKEGIGGGTGIGPLPRAINKEDHHSVLAIPCTSSTLESGSTTLETTNPSGSTTAEGDQQSCRSTPSDLECPQESTTQGQDDDDDDGDYDNDDWARFPSLRNLKLNRVSSSRKSAKQLGVRSGGGGDNEEVDVEAAPVTIVRTSSKSSLRREGSSRRELWNVSDHGHNSLAVAAGLAAASHHHNQHHDGSTTTKSRTTSRRNKEYAHMASSSDLLVDDDKQKKRSVADTTTAVEGKKSSLKKGSTAISSSNDKNTPACASAERNSNRNSCQYWSVLMSGIRNGELVWSM